VVDDDPVSDTDATAPGTGGDHLAARLVTGDHTLIGLRPVAKVLPVDRPDVAAADRRRLHGQQHLPVARLRYFASHHRDPAVSRQHDAGHRAHDLST
jgi:hypothetical protein